MSADEFPSGILAVIVDEEGVPWYVSRGEHEVHFKSTMIATRRRFRADQISLQKHDRPVLVEGRVFWQITLFKTSGKKETLLFRSKRSWREHYAWLTKVIYKAT